MTAPLLQLNAVSKSFGAVRALKGVSFDLQAGEVHALLGENGAGKSTLIKVITGAHQPDGGSIEINGERVAHLSSLGYLRDAFGRRRVRGRFLPLRVRAARPADRDGGAYRRGAHECSSSRDGHAAASTQYLGQRSLEDQAPGRTTAGRNGC